MATEAGVLQNRFRKMRGSLVISERCRFSLFAFPLFLLAATYMTSLFEKMPRTTQNFNLAISSLSVFLLIMAFSKHGLYRLRSSLWRRLFYLLLMSLSLAWGILFAMVLMKYSVGWTSVFLILSTLTISAIHIAVFTPDLRIFVLFQLLLMAPGTYISMQAIGGNVGFSMALFFIGFFAISIVIGLIQYRQFWRAEQQTEKLQAVLNAAPGTFCWVSADLKYQNLNERFARLIKAKRSKILQQTVGESIDDKNLLSFFKEVFQVSQKSHSRILDVGKKKFFFSSRRFNDDSDAVVLGFDVTDQFTTQEQLEFQRAQTHSSAKYAVRGELFNFLNEDIEKPLEGLEDQLSRLQEVTSGKADKELIEDIILRTQLIHSSWSVMQLLLSNYKKDEKRIIPIQNLLTSTERVISQKTKADDIEFKINVFSEGAEVLCHPSDILLVFLNLISNSIDALKESDDKIIEVAMQDEGESVILTFTDSGPGVPDYLTDVIFEPNFTTKGPEHTTGLGLSLSRSIVEDHGGKIEVINDDSATQFRIQLPKSKKSA